MASSCDHRVRLYPGGGVMKSARVTTLIGMAAAIMVLGALPASSHSDSKYLPGQWQVSSETYHFTTSVPDDYKAPLTDALAPWNNLPDSNFDFAHGVDVPNFPYSGCNKAGTPAKKSAIHVGPIDGGKVQNMMTANTVARVTLCYVNTFSSSRIVSSNMQIDEDDSFHTGTGSPGLFDPGIDLQSVATHEWGHMFGFNGPWDSGHFSQHAAICDKNRGDLHTMCPHLPGNRDTRFRTLESHDAHVIQNGY